MRVLIWAMLFTTLILGCKKQPDAAPTTQNSPASRPSTRTTAPANIPAAISMDGRVYDFPPAKVSLINRGERVIALLYSDDPPNAANDDYAGHGFYLELPLEIPQGGSLAGSRWDYKASSTEREETMTGIFLQGRRMQLQPYDVHAEFKTDEAPIKLAISGSFLLFDNEAQQPGGKLVQVEAVLEVDVTVRQAAK